MMSKKKRRGQHGTKRSTGSVRRMLKEKYPQPDASKHGRGQDGGRYSGCRQSHRVQTDLLSGIGQINDRNRVSQHNLAHQPVPTQMTSSVMMSLALSMVVLLQSYVHILGPRLVSPAMIY
jgi:hypothetical protein